MRKQSDIRQPSGADHSEPDRPEGVRSEDIHIRNYDHRWGYDLSLEVVNTEGTVVFEKRYYLPPGHAESELDIVTDDEYEIRATLDNLQKEALRCRIDDEPDNSAVVEIGNGVVSLTQGHTG